jgi:hypothetical protein
MGEAELHPITNQLVIHSVFFVYGDAASNDMAWRIANDISTLWNEPKGKVKLAGDWFDVSFEIEAYYDANLDPEKVWYNDNPRYNFFRIEEYATGNISFVDGVGGNTGYFKLDNLLQTATTAAHEYGHSLGLDHPTKLDIRGMAAPGIMYPRGTLVDPPYQYDPNAQAGKPGGTMDPAHRKVLATDIDNLKLNKAYFVNNKATIGQFTSLYHEKQTPQ